MNFKKNVLIGLIFSIFYCSIFHIPDPKFYEDTIFNREAMIKFDPEKMPIPDVTTEEELLEMYNNKITARFTYFNPYPKKIFGKDLIVKRSYWFKTLKHKSISSDNTSGYKGVDYLNMIVFIDERGLVAEYLINHKVKRSSSDDKWVPGPYMRRDPNTKLKETYIDVEVDHDCYWLQRRDRLYKDRSYRDSEYSCPYWEGVTAW
jgi:hypothetical protein